MSLLRSFHHFKNANIVSPGQLCNNLLHKCLIWVRFGEGPHVFQVSCSKARHAGKGLKQVPCQAVHYFAAPLLRLLTGKNIFANAPVKQYEFPVHRKRSPDLRAADTFFQFLQKRLVAVRQFRKFSLHGNNPA